MKPVRPNKGSTLNRLYVEGADDFHVVCALVRKSGVAWTAADARIPYAPDTNGDSDAIAKAVVAVKSRTPRVGLIVDGDAKPSDRWQAIRGGFGELSVELPDAYPADGIIVSPGGARLGVWMMPHGGRPGAVEAFIAASSPVADVLVRWFRELYLT